MQSGGMERIVLRGRDRMETHIRSLIDVSPDVFWAEALSHVSDNHLRGFEIAGLGGHVQRRLSAVRHQVQIRVLVQQ